MEHRIQPNLQPNILQTNPHLLECFSAVRKALEGNKQYLTNHPDVITPLDDAYVGIFPDNIEQPLWMHIGYTGSYHGATPVEELEIHGLLKLTNSSFVLFRWGCWEDQSSRHTFSGWVSRTVEKLMNNAHPRLRQKFLEETVDLSPPPPVLLPTDEHTFFSGEQLDTIYSNPGANEGRCITPKSPHLSPIEDCFTVEAPATPTAHPPRSECPPIRRPQAVRAEILNQTLSHETDTESVNEKESVFLAPPSPIRLVPSDWSFSQQVSTLRGWQVEGDD